MIKQRGVFDFVEHERKIDKLLKKEFSYSFMSNAKWRKLFSLLDSLVPEMQVIWKFVDSKNDGVRYGIPSLKAIEDSYLNNQFWYGPVYYKEIEWLEFPRINKPYGRENIPGAFICQDIDNVRKALEGSGSWQIEESQEGFRLYGHKK